MKEFTLLVATGGLTFLLVLMPAVLLLRSRIARGIYVFLLFPLSAVCQVTQLIMYREFGTEIGERAKGLFEGNITAPWPCACSEYHVPWLIAGTLLISLLLTGWACRPTRCRWNPTAKAFGGAALVFLATGALALGLNPQLERIAQYHPTKISSAPLFQVLTFINNYYLQDRGSSFADILEQTGPMTEASERDEIARRLDQSLEVFVTRTVQPPSWLKKKPSHVFLFLLESYGYGLIEDPASAGITPHLRQFAAEGLSVPHFSSANNQTITSVHAMASGAAPLPSYPAPRALSHYALDTLPGLLQRAGYQSLFYAASYRHFGSKGDFCEGYGYERFDSCPEEAPLVLPEGERYQTLGSPVWDDSPERISSAGDLVLAREGYFNRTGQLVRPLPGPVEPDPEWDGRRKLLRASAVEALSWGYVNLRKPGE